MYMRNYKHIAKDTHANAITKTLSKSLQSQRTERNCFKKFADTKKIKNADTSRHKRKKKNENDTETQ